MKMAAIPGRPAPPIAQICLAFTCHVVAKWRTMQREYAERLAALMREARGSRSFREMERLSKAEDGSFGIAATSWKRYENPDVMTSVRPNANKLMAVARAIGADPSEVFEAAGMPAPRLPRREPTLAPQDPSTEVPAALSALWAELDPFARERLMGFAMALHEARMVR